MQDEGEPLASKVCPSFSFLLYRERDAISVNRELIKIGSKLNMVPLALLVLGVATYGRVVSFLLLRRSVLIPLVHILTQYTCSCHNPGALLSASGVPYVRLSSLHLIDPLTAVHALYGPVEPASTWEGNVLARFSEEHDGDRLSVGPVVISTGGLVANHDMFEVMRKR